MRNLSAAPCLASSGFRVPSGLFAGVLLKRISLDAPRLPASMGFLTAVPGGVTTLGWLSEGRCCDSFGLPASFKVFSMHSGQMPCVTPVFLSLSTSHSDILNMLLHHGHMTGMVFVSRLLRLSLEIRCVNSVLTTLSFSIAFPYPESYEFIIALKNHFYMKYPEKSDISLIHYADLQIIAQFHLSIVDIFKCRF